MRGRRDFTPKLFYELSLDCLVPQEDFYRKVNQHLELHFLYKATAHTTAEKDNRALTRWFSSKYCWWVISTTSIATELY